jgi:hypothetical protein
MQTPSIGGNTFLTFFDDFSRNTWIYFLKHKYEALGCFQQFKSLVERLLYQLLKNWQRRRVYLKRIYELL